MPGTFLLVECFGLCALASTIQATVFIATEDWHGWFNIFWLKPGDSFLSAEFALFALVAAAFVGAAILALTRRWDRGIWLAGLACLLSGAAVLHLAQRAGMPVGASVLAVHLVPALFLAWRAERAGRLRLGLD